MNTQQLKERLEKTLETLKETQSMLTQVVEENYGLHDRDMSVAIGKLETIEINLVGVVSKMKKVINTL